MNTKQISISIFSFLILGCSNPPAPNQSTEKEIIPEIKKEISIENPKKEAKVTITKYYDFACGYCRKGAKIMQALKAKYQDDLHIEFRHFVVHPSVNKAHKAVECANEQGKFEAYFYEYFDNHYAQTSDKELFAVAKKTELNEDTFRSCLSSSRTQQVINSHRQFGELIGIRGTPNFIINGKNKIAGAIPQAEFEKIIDGILAEGK